MMDLTDPKYCLLKNTWKFIKIVIQIRSFNPKIRLFLFKYQVDLVVYTK